MSGSGEKLCEELFFEGADSMPTVDPKILRELEASAEDTERVVV